MVQVTTLQPALHKAWELPLEVLRHHPLDHRLVHKVHKLENLTLEPAVTFHRKVLDHPMSEDSRISVAHHPVMAITSNPLVNQQVDHSKPQVEMNSEASKVKAHRSVQIQEIPVILMEQPMVLPGHSRVGKTIKSSRNGC